MYDCAYVEVKVVNVWHSRAICVCGSMCGCVSTRAGVGVVWVGMCVWVYVGCERTVFVGTGGECG
jgi:hypothetical protein